MKVCQIATVGRNPEWIQIGLFRYPTNLLVLVTTKEYLEKAKEIEELVKGIETKIEIIKEPRNAQYIVKFLKTLINNLSENQYEIMINVTAGLVSWQLLFYSTATILRKKVKSFFIIDKERKEPLQMVLYHPLTSTEEKVLMIIPEEGGSLGKITQEFRDRTLKDTGEEKGSSGLISRYLKMLIEEELVESVGNAKSKTFRLTEKGKLVRNILS
jgi:hypothetical protein